MIPYFEWKTIALGPVTLQVWGLMVALGFATGALAAQWMAKRRGDDPSVILDLTAWMVLAGMIGGRLGHVFFYEFPFYAAYPKEIFAFWHGGFSMFGGLIACVAVGLWLLRKKGVNVWRYADTAAFGLPFGIMIGRIGCFLIHDHPGTATDFALGVQYPDGVVRHDHGLYEVINGALMALTFLLIAKLHRKHPPGLFLSIFALWYGAFRFVTDFWRAIDTRYFGLTPGQYFGLILAAGGGALLWITIRRKVA